MKTWTTWHIHRRSLTVSRVTDIQNRLHLAIHCFHSLLTAFLNLSARKALLESWIHMSPSYICYHCTPIPPFSQLPCISLWAKRVWIPQSLSIKDEILSKLTLIAKASVNQIHLRCSLHHPPQRLFRVYLRRVQCPPHSVTSVLVTVNVWIPWTYHPPVLCLSQPFTLFKICWW